MNGQERLLKGHTRFFYSDVRRTPPSQGTGKRLSIDVFEIIYKTENFRSFFLLLKAAQAQGQHYRHFYCD